MNKMLTGRAIFVALFAIGVQVIFSDAQRDERIEVNGRSAPTGVSILALRTTPTSAVILWNSIAAASSYVIRIYRYNSIIVKEVRNVRISFHNVTGLEGGTSYNVTVSAIYREGGRTVESAESERESFRTAMSCTNGRVHVQCSAHCISTCKDPDPVCSRICSSGCACPKDIPIWHNGRCMPRLLCPHPKGTPIKPRNLRVLPTDGTEVFLSWDPVDAAISYTVEVKLPGNEDVVIRRLQTEVPVIIIPNLTPGEIYIFSVQANLRMGEPTRISPRSSLPPTGVTVSGLTNNSFTVSWNYAGEVARYSFVLYGSNQQDVIYFNEKVPSNGLTVEGLAPGTTYYFSIASARTKERPGRRTGLREVTTAGVQPASRRYFSAQVFGIVNVPTTVPTTTTAPPTTTTPPMTRCRQLYQSVEMFYMSFPGIDGPSYPNCDENGLFVTRECSDDSFGVCWCVNPQDGSKISGSKFGGSNSAYQLNCDRFGSLNTERIRLRAGDVKSTSVILSWKRVQGVSGYVLVMENDGSDGTTISVPARSGSHLLRGLLSGQSYRIGIFAVNGQGWASRMSTTVVTTSQVDAPENLKIDSYTSNSVTLSWSHNPSAEAYSVRLLSASTGQTLRNIDDVSTASFTIPGLTSSQEYIVQVRAVAREYGAAEPIVHVSKPASISVQLSCKPSKPLDIIYVIDTSQESGWSGLQKVKNLMADITSDLAPLNLITGTRVAAVKYYRRASTMFHYRRFSKAHNAIGAIKYLPYNGTPLNTVAMLQHVTLNFFSRPVSDSYRKRPNAISATIIFSGGRSQNSRQISQAAASLKSRTNVIALGVQGKSDDSELTKIASRPDLKLTAPSFDELSRLKDVIINKLCTL